MSNNPMKRPVHKRRIRTIRVMSQLSPDVMGPAAPIRLRKGMWNWRAKAGQREDRQ